MSDLFWPGDERAGRLMSETALLDAMVQVESAWLAALRAEGIAPNDLDPELSGLVAASDVDAVAAGAEPGGNPVISLISLLRKRCPGRPEGRWLHRGLTSQDVLDTALTLCLRDVLDRLAEELVGQVVALAELADRYRHTLQSGRTLTQPAVPITFGVKVAAWLRAILDSAEEMGALTLPVQLGGAAGTLAAPVELARLAGRRDPAMVAMALAEHTGRRLGLAGGPPWHTSRAPVTRVGDALVRRTDAFGRIANDVLTLSRPEIGELAEPAAEGRGSSSTMPHKQNPVLSVLIRRAALAAPGLGAQLHLAAAEARDERPDGAWHLEWAGLRDLGRRTVVAASQTTELLQGLRVDPARMRANAESAGLLAEAASLAEFTGGEAVTKPDDYLGAAELIIEETLRRARSG